jgi:hypothetical protein
MHIYLRLNPENQLETYSTEEVEHLRECLRQAPGVESIKDISRHPKGGYAVQLNGSKDHLEPLLQHVSARGFVPVV